MVVTWWIVAFLCSSVYIYNKRMFERDNANHYTENAQYKGYKATTQDQTPWCLRFHKNIEISLCD